MRRFSAPGRRARLQHAGRARVYASVGASTVEADPMREWPGAIGMMAIGAHVRCGTRGGTTDTPRSNGPHPRGHTRHLYSSRSPFAAPGVPNATRPVQGFALGCASLSHLTLQPFSLPPGIARHVPAALIGRCANVAPAGGCSQEGPAVPTQRGDQCFSQLSGGRQARAGRAGAICVRAARTGSRRVPHQCSHGWVAACVDSGRARHRGVPRAPGVRRQRGAGAASVMLLARPRCEGSPAGPSTRRAPHCASRCSPSRGAQCRDPA